MNKLTIRIRSTAAVSALMASGPIWSAAGVASAPEPRLILSSEVPMTIVGFDASTARRAGNSITMEYGDRVLRDSNGVEVARIPKAARGGRIQPNNTVYGTCGSSYVYLYDLAGASFAMKTGFSVNGNAFDFDWYVNVRGEDSVQIDNWDWSDSGPQFPSSSWTSGYQTSSQDTFAGSYSVARVVSGQAILTSGVICTSGHPSDGKILYR